MSSLIFVGLFGTSELTENNPRLTLIVNLGFYLLFLQPLLLVDLSDGVVVEFACVKPYVVNSYLYDNYVLSAVVYPGISDICQFAVRFS